MVHVSFDGIDGILGIKIKNKEKVKGKNIRKDLQNSQDKGFKDSVLK